MGSNDKQLLHISDWSLAWHREMEKENEEDREVIHNKEETRVKGGEMT